MLGMVGGTILWGDNKVHAAPSYTGIELLRSKDTINILEITPDTYLSAIGWYVEGGEPFNMADYLNINLEKSADERKTIMQGYLDSIMGTSLWQSAGSASTDFSARILASQELRYEDPFVYREIFPSRTYSYESLSRYNHVVLDDRYKFEMSGQMVFAAEGTSNYFNTEVIGELKDEYIYMGPNSYASYYFDDVSYTDKIDVYSDEIWLAGYSNSNWFAQYVLDWDSSEGDLPNIKVNTLVPNHVTVTDVQNADLVVITSGFSWNGASLKSFDSTNDISAAVVAEILNSAVGIGSTKTNLDGALPVVLDQNVLRNLSSSSGTLGVEDIFTGLVGSTSTSGVYGSVFLYNAVNDATNGMEMAVQSTQVGYFDVGTQGNLVTRSFYDPFAESEYKADNTPFNDVYTAITAENSWRNANGLGEISDDVSVATSIRHIMLYKTQAPIDAKDSVDVLVIQPGPIGSSVSVSTSGVYNDLPVSSTVADGEVPWETLTSWLGVTKDTINVVKMSTQEFTSHTADLEETYDLIYIGSDISGLNATTGTEKDVYGSGDADMSYRVYNNGSKKGLIYTSTGESDGSAINDISARNQIELATYAQNGGAILIAPHLCAPDGQNLTIKLGNTNTVESGSNLSKLFDAIYSYTNVIRQDALESATYSEKNIAALQSSVHRSTPEISLKSSPVAYSAAAPSNNGSTLTFQFSIQNHVDTDGKRYQVKLLIDSDTDGIFSEVNEIVGGLSVTVGASGASTSVSTSNLQTDLTYTANVTLQANYNQAVSWKLAVSEVGQSQKGTSEQGITYITPIEEYALNVLQINGTGGISIESNASMMKFLGNGTSANEFVDSKYDVTVHTISDTNFNAISHAEGLTSISHSGMVSFLNEVGLTGMIPSGVTNIGYLQVLMECYDVVVVGYGAPSLDADSLAAINQYVANSENNLIYTNGAFASGSTVLGTTSVKSDLVAVAGSSTYKPIANMLLTSTSGSASSSTQTAKSVITSYPYDLNKTSFSVTGATNPAMKVDTSNADLQVWYALSDGSNYYSKMTNDARNAYFAYSLNNVTYIGSTGKSSLSDDEAKLMANALLAACDVATVPPEVTVTDSTGSSQVGHILIPWSDATGGPKAPTAEDPYYLYFMVSEATDMTQVDINMWYQATAETLHSEQLYPESDNYYVPYSPVAVKVGTGASVDLASKQVERNTLYQIQLSSSVVSAFSQLKEEGIAEQQFIVKATSGNDHYTTTVNLITVSLLALG